MPEVKKTAVLIVDRLNQGEAQYRLYIDGVLQELNASTAKWDDASPWAAGTYNMRFEPFHGKTDAFVIYPVAGRSAIKFHSGSVTGHSEGCIVTPVANIKEIEQVLADNGIARNDLKMQVNGDFGFGFTIQAHNLRVQEGDKINLTLSLNGLGNDDGVSKDVWVHVRPQGTASYPLDLKPTNPQTLPNYEISSSKDNKGAGFWVRIPKGQKSVDFTVDVKTDTLKEPMETVKFTIDNYKIVNIRPGHATRFYTPSNYQTILDNNVWQNVNPVQIRDRSSDVSLHADGGYEGFSRAVAVAAGSNFQLDFNAQTIPDRIRIWDASTGTVYVDTDYMSNLLDASFTVDADSEGTLRVAVLTNDPGTAWNLDLFSQDQAATLFRFSTLSMDDEGEGDSLYDGLVDQVVLQAGSQTVTAMLSTTAMSEPTTTPEDDDEDDDAAFEVGLERTGDISQALTIGWRVEGLGDSPVDAGDFGDALPSGLIAFEAGESYGYLSFAPAVDAALENPERFRIVFFDPATGEVLTPDGTSGSALVGMILPPPAGLIVGTEQDDLLDGDALDNTIDGQAGNDTLLGGDGNDYLDGGDGDDLLDGGSGTNYLAGGEGSDLYRVQDLSGAIARTTIDDSGSPDDFDTLELGEIGDAKLDFIGSGNDLIITNLETLQAVRVVGQFSGAGIEAISYTRFGSIETLIADNFAASVGVRTYHLGDGNLSIDAMTANSGARLILSSELSGYEQAFSRPSDDPQALVIDVGDGSTIVIANLFTISEVAGGFTGITAPDGTVLSIADLQEMAPVLGTSDGETIQLGDGNDVIQARGGDDLVEGGAGSDVYDYALGDGNDTILDTRFEDPDGDQNLLRLHGVTPDQVTGQRVDNNVLLALPDGGSILLDHQLGVELPHRNEHDQPISGGVTSILFDDGTLWDAEAIKAAIGYVAPRPAPLGTTGNDTLIGDYWDDDIEGLAGNDRIDGGAGDDRLFGGAGKDELIGGEGNDLLKGGAGRDTLLGGAGEDRLHGGDGTDLLKGGSDDDRLYGEGGADEVHGGGGRDTVFAGDSDMADDVLDGGAGRDTLDYSEAGSGITFDFAQGIATSATEGSDSFSGFERVVGSQQGDTFALDGTTVHVLGGGGADAYLIGTTAEGAVITITDASGEGNSLQLDGLTAEDVIVRFVAEELPSGGGEGPAMRALSGDDGSPAALEIEVVATGALIRLPAKLLGFDENGNKQFALGQIAFGDGTVWNAADIARNAWVRGGDGYDSLHGSSGSDTFDGGRNEDWIRAGVGTDRVVYRAGDGNDVITTDTSAPGTIVLELLDLSLADVVLERSESSLIVKVVSSGEQVRVEDQFNGLGLVGIHFADGQTVDRDYIDAHAIIPPVIGTDGYDELYGGSNPDLLDGRLGNDQLSGAGGNDTYLYRSGDGSDMVYDFGGDTGDVLKLLDIDLADVRFSMAGQDLKVTMLATGQVVTLKYYRDGVSSADIVEFSDGSTLDREGIAELVGRVDGTTGDDVLSGTSGDDRFYGYDGDDVLSSDQGDDLYLGGHGNDVITSGFGADTYAWAKGDGNDQINDFVAYGPSDLLQLTDVDPGEVSLSRNGNDLLIQIVPTGEVITVTAQYPGTTGIGVDYIQFADGSYWSRADMADASAPIVELTGTEASEALDGTSGKDLIHAGDGDDQVRGFEGRDTLFGEAGNDHLDGGYGDDVLSGGTGDDTMGGGDGNDVYRFARGDGQDTILESIDYWGSGNGGNDRLELDGITSNEVVVTQENGGHDLKFDFGQGDSIVIGNSPLSDGGNVIEQVVFADGTVWSAADLVSRSFTPTEGPDHFGGTNGGETIASGAGDDWINGREGNDILIGGAGNDTLGGGGGNDVYRFARGDGQDTILEGIDYWDGGNGGEDRIEFGVGINAAEVVVTQESGGHDLKLDLGQGDSIYIGYGPITDGGNAIEQVIFADGTIWSAGDLFARSVLPTAGADHFAGTYGDETIAGAGGDDWINGREGSDILVGGGGNDTLGGGGGNDVYRFARGDGQDTILEGIDYWDGGNGGEDRIELGVGITPGQVTVTQESGGHDLKLDLGEGDSIYIGYGPITDGGNAIEQVIFADGTVWTAADLFARSVLPTAGADHFAGTYGDETIAGAAGDDWINGRGGDDILIGGAGNDALGGGGGNDVYRFARGDGQDTILEGIDYWDGGNGGEDRIELGVGITPGQVTVTQESGGHDLKLNLGDGDGIYIGYGPITDGGNAIEQVVFADGTIWSAADLFARSVLPTAGADHFAGTYGDETIAGAAGDDWINGRGGNDILIGGAGNDTLGGGSGDDVYRFARGDGQDTILEGIDYWDGGNGGDDRIELGVGITPGDVTVTAENGGQDLKLDLGEGDSIYIGYGPVNDWGNRIEQVAFTDGTIWTHDDLVALSSVGAGAARRQSQAPVMKVIDSGAVPATVTWATQLVEAAAAFDSRASGSLDLHSEHRTHSRLDMASMVAPSTLRIII